MTMKYPSWQFAFVVSGLLLSAQAVCAAPISQGKVVLRLSYQGDLATSSKQVYSLGVTAKADNSQVGTLMGTDWQGNIYLSNPVPGNAIVLRRFDKGGKFREAWSPAQVPHGLMVAVTKDGYIWTGVNSPIPDGDGAFVLVYKSGKKQPVADWRTKLPRDIQSKLDAAAQKNGVHLSHMSKFYVAGMSAGEHHVSVQLFNGGLGVVNRLGRVGWIVCDSTGTTVADAGTVVGDLPQLAANDTQQWWRYDYGSKFLTWNKVWCWDKGKPMGQPFIDRTKQPEPFAPYVSLRKANPPSVYEDAKHHTYVFLSRENSNLPSGRIIVGKQTYDDLRGAPLQDECALIVLDDKKRVITYIPWTRAVLTTSTNWIKPLPDGSGFYRIQFAEKEARIYFHALPK